MEKFTGVRKEGRGYYSIWLNGEVLGSASNPTQAQEKFAKEVARAQMNAERAATNAAWEAKRAPVASRSMSQVQLESLCPDFYSM